MCQQPVCTYQQSRLHVPAARLHVQAPRLRVRAARLHVPASRLRVPAAYRAHSKLQKTSRVRGSPQRGSRRD